MIEGAQGAVRLMEALEKLSEWSGGDPGAGPSGSPAPDVVREFEDAMSAPESGVSAVASDDGADAAAWRTESPDPGPAETSAEPGVVRINGESQPLGQDAVRALEELVGSGPVRPEVLLRAQCLVGMLGADAKMGAQTSQNVSQSAESLLRQSG